MTLSRRDLFAALIGAPLAQLACRREPARVSGSIRGAALAVGHRLQRREELAKATVERASGEPVRTGTLIVGAGPSGLSAAWRLERLGIRDYLLLDRSGLKVADVGSGAAQNRGRGYRSGRSGRCVTRAGAEERRAE